MIKIRNAQPTDAIILSAAEKAIAAIPGFLVSKPEEIHSQNFHKRIEELNSIPNGKYIVAEQDGDIVGHAMLDPMGLKAIEHIVRLTIAVHPGHEEKGIGEQLLTHLIDWAKSNPAVKKIELNVRSCNTRAIRLYQKLGFNVEGRIRNRVRISDNEFVDDLEMGLFVKNTETLPTVVNLAIGQVVSTRQETIDDNWDSVESYVELDSLQFTADALKGLESFSHVEIIFFMNQVDVRKIEKTARHPRNYESWPKVGIFAQRGKNRPNQLGTAICKIIKIEGLRIYLQGLDAVNGTPVLDIKPWVNEFGPRGQTFQPEWISELMLEYWNIK